jgi:LPS export ABC transporter protein LptC
VALFENRFITLFLAILAVFSTWAVYFVEHRGQLNKNYGHYPDSIGFNLKLSNFDQFGFLTQIIYSKKAVHDPLNKTTDFTDVTIQLFNQNNNPPWSLTAPAATVDDNGEKIIEHGLLTMQQASYARHYASTLMTRDVTLFAAQKYLYTAAPIKFLQTGLQLDARGARYDYNDHILTLYHQVHTIYQPALRRQ